MQTRAEKVRQIKCDLQLERRDLELPVSRGALEVLAHLRALQRRCRVVCPSVERLGSMVGRSARSVQRYLSELSTQGVVVRLYRGGQGRRCIYYVRATPGRQFDGWKRLGARQGDATQLEELAGQQLEELQGEQLEELAGEQLEELQGEQLEELAGQQLEEPAGQQLEEPAGQQLEELQVQQLQQLTQKLFSARKGAKSGAVKPPRSTYKETPQRENKDGQRLPLARVRTAAPSVTDAGSSERQARLVGPRSRLNEAIPAAEWSRLWGLWRWSWKRHQGGAYLAAPADPRILAWIWKQARARSGGSSATMRLARVAWLMDQHASRGAALWLFARDAHHYRPLPSHGSLVDKWCARVTRDASTAPAQAAAAAPVVTQDNAPADPQVARAALAQMLAMLDQKRTQGSK